MKLSVASDGDNHWESTTSALSGSTGRRLAEAAQVEGGVEAAAWRRAREGRDPAAPVVQRPDVGRAVQVRAQLQELARVAADARAPGGQAGRRLEGTGELPGWARGLGGRPRPQQEHARLFKGL
jgi:hypothetical protein